MATTYVDYTATASQTDFAFNFEYLEDEHVIVEINGTAQLSSAFSIVTSPAKKVVLNVGATAGDVVRVRRKSQPDTNLVDFVNGSVLTESELDRAYLHNRYLNEEIAELNDSSLQIEAGGTDWDARTKKIKNLAAPTLTTDAVTKLYVDNKVNQGLYGSDAPLKWQFLGTAGTNTTYTVTGAAISGDTVYDVSINGLVQEPTVDYTVNPDTDTLTIKTTLVGGEDIVVIQRGFGVAVTGTVGTSSLVDGSVTNPKLAADSVTSVKLATDAVTTAKIAANAVDGTKIADGAVTSAKIGADAVDGTKIADDSIDSEHYVDGSIDEAHIADNQITAAKITSSDTTFNIQPTGEVSIGTASPLNGVELTINGFMILANYDADVVQGTILGRCFFAGRKPGGVVDTGAAIVARGAGTATNSSNDVPCELSFYTNAGGLAPLQERLIIDKDGNFFIGNTEQTPSTPSGGGYLYVESGALKYRGSSGTVTTLGLA